MLVWNYEGRKDDENLFPPSLSQKMLFPVEIEAAICLEQDRTFHTPGSDHQWLVAVYEEIARQTR
jgi:hypothetical protein